MSVLCFHGFNVIAVLMHESMMALYFRRSCLGLAFLHHVDSRFRYSSAGEGGRDVGYQLYVFFVPRCEDIDPVPDGAPKPVHVQQNSWRGWGQKLCHAFLI
ncbi:hypothetical protein KSP39_PZI019044 [Platanthera zijinensis]|uniref:Uncharacterized protein n=1 Tax=Platanthera zijinensis TaxID=2320716 RepID=A0AAP0FYV2_9ASPA